MKKIVFSLLILTFLTPVYSLQAQSVDLLWQGDTYTSPFYKGRTLWSSQSRIKLVAIPQELGSSANLNYKWTKNGVILGNISGVGKNYLSFSDSILSKPQSVKVEIISNQNTVLASASVIITPITSKLTVYENNPLYGFMFHKEVGKTYQLLEREITLSAFPFFFDILNRTDDAIDYEWNTNAGVGKNGSSVTYRTPDNTAGSSEIRVRVSNKNDITQDINKNFLIKFENNTKI
ncbi:MAG: hypothetical protein UT07_C0003G0009 [Parcubacteria group bacterium GW2011_GWB1_38_8]|uniref:Uncharacterized protein n=1 Tax=Candidatus Zambryskibacteria bacterium RIFCSPLOWO2_02_FULL_39_14 TaxID=1802769 RepID=A0A1G2UH79_9BACT|nr:MAG: hypothetical protein UT07_C0003G0009 [Parcubacteria group bacterium GW2011_GWB1_38_8]KKR30860.1 MAG: hypothetical protein UT62_C0006G0018 [Parcubacteria group bacterium GW2011_GWC1_39_8]OHA95180.1 MAG: hypothetical protein A3C62_01140 [Candidatus Zambryskibacteria bacterium RIFCSPHIGHO2_02_FULL_39_16]OHB08789.1 MAG: hypothetical protein A3I86_02045 [Candidatus Zambryskibacteria bacterium RIFCSPLOWO2_02_FULL_39_14]